MVLPSPAVAVYREKLIEAGFEVMSILRDAWEGFGDKSADIRNLAICLDMPVRFAWAKRDRLIPLSVCMPCIRRMKHVSISRFNAGHAAFLEQPKEFIREFLNFAETLDASSPRLAAS